MGREKKGLPAAVTGGPKERHRRAQRSQYDPKAPVPDGFVAKPTAPKTKYQSYFEFVENTDKKKKLEFQVTSKRSPPPGFEFVPIGNPELTSACKELSRSKDAMIFIVSNTKDAESTNLSHQVHRVGHHVRQTIVEEARNSLQQPAEATGGTAMTVDGQPEPIPESQAEYNQQVDAAIRDLFPRIPNTDRQEIIEHAFTRGATFKGDKPVGLSADITLARRVQLAVLAHIRHNHTRYDMLLKETTWQNARKVVESLCLDILVKWRGDEETGRDQLDEILREVVIISDSDDEDDEQETDNTSADDAPDGSGQQEPVIQVPMLPQAVHPSSPKPTLAIYEAPPGAVSGARLTMSNRVADKRGFKRYRAWNEALRRNQAGGTGPPHSAEQECYPPRQQGGFPDNTTQLPGHGYALPGTLSHTDPPGMVPSSRSHLLPTTYERPETEHIAQQPVSPVTNGFQDLLVRSIEPASPDAPQSYYIRTLPPRNVEPVPRSPLGSRPHRPRRLVSPPREFVAVHAPPYLGRRVVSDQLPQERAVYGGYPENPAYGSSLPRSQHRLLPRHDGYAEPPGPTPLSRPGTLDSYPSKRIIIDAPRPGERSNPVLMEDRGGYYERVQTSTVMDAAPSMPAFVTIQRSLPEDNRIANYPRGVHPGLEPDFQREGQLYHRAADISYEQRHVPHPQPSRIVNAPRHMDEHVPKEQWIPRRSEHGPNLRSGVETLRHPSSKAQYPAPPHQHSWAEPSYPGAPPEASRQHAQSPHVYHHLDSRPQVVYDAPSGQYRRLPHQEHVIVLD